MRHSPDIVIDKADESNFSKPAYYVKKQKHMITIIIRGTANGSDTMVDLNAG